MLSLEQFHTVLVQENARGYGLDEDQRAVVDFGNGPLWILAGPGTGKTEALVTRTLKLICVDGVTPSQIFLTTFTKKAARNLEDRLATYFTALKLADPALADVDLADIHIGTIHSLCDDILHEFRYPPYQNVRLLDDVDQHLFLYRYAEISNHVDRAFWEFFEYAVPNWNARSQYDPTKWQRAKTAAVLFNHIVEDQVDLTRMQAAGGHWEVLANFYRQYADVLATHFRCDFAHIQLRFLEFLNSPSGQLFLSGNGEDRTPLTHILVDEYQDTNPIQERIYLQLASIAPHNLAVVGDDDQALYRFRGGTVDCMVNFDRACLASFQQEPTQIQLRNNYRSHPAIVSFFNEYITAFPEMNTPGVRAPNKQPVNSSSDISGNYPAVGWITRKQVGQLPDAVADLIQNHLVADGIISDLSQCVLLMRSTKDSPRNAGPFLAAFQDRGIPVYNPRSKSFLESEEVQCLLAALINTIDLDFIWTNHPSNSIRSNIQNWLNTLVTLNDELNFIDLQNYVENSSNAIRDRCQQAPGQFLDVNMMEIIYRILSMEPFTVWQRDLVRNSRLSKVTRLFESYHSLNLDTLRARNVGASIDDGFLNRFYNMFIGYLVDSGIDDDEDEDVVVPQGALPIMTIHQSKGLEFPFVIVAQVGNSGTVGAAQLLEQNLQPFRQQLYPRQARSPQELSLEDDIRLLYVAYSRAEYGLIIVGTPQNIKNHVAAPNRDATWFRRNIPAIVV